MAKLTAKGTTCPQALQKTLTRCRNDFQRTHAEWLDMYEGFRERIPQDRRERLKALGNILWRFDLRFRWATGVTALELDDRVVTKATTAPTRQGYFLLMRLVDLWFSLDLAFELYRALLVSPQVKHPNVLETVRRDAPRRLRAVRAAEQVAASVLTSRMKRAAKRERLVHYLRTLAEEAEASKAAVWTVEAADRLGRKRPIETHHVLAIAQTIRNRYVHGGETASSRGFPAQEKVPVLRLLTGTAQLSCLVLARTGAEELLKQLRRQVGIR